MDLCVVYESGANVLNSEISSHSQRLYIPLQKL